MIDTNVLTGALLSADGVNRGVLRACLERRVQPIVGQTLFNEYEDVFGRSKLFANCPLNAFERAAVLNAFLSVSEWVKVYFSWRPNLIDEGDNHLIELAVAGSADMVVTHNYRDLVNAKLRFPEIRIVRPETFLEELR